MIRLKGIEGIDKEHYNRLKEVGVLSVEALLDKGGSPEGRSELAKSSGIDEEQLLRWLNIVDLFRIRGIGEEYADLLELAGIDTISELAECDPRTLHRTLIGANEKKSLVRQLPSVNQVKSWIEQARQLPRIVKY